MKQAKIAQYKCHSINLIISCENNQTQMLIKCYSWHSFTCYQDQVTHNTRDENAANMSVTGFILYGLWQVK